MANPPVQARRVSARVLLVDEDDQVLLFFNSSVQGGDYFFTVGGRAEEGESLAEAAAREVFEETGLRTTPESLGPVVCRREGPGAHGEVRWYAEEHYYFLRSHRFEPDFSGLDEGERAEIARHAWLSLADLEATDAVVFPRGLAVLLKRLLDGERPEPPIRLPWVDLPSE